MNNNGQKHKNYEILNLIGYGLSKFNEELISEFGFTTKNAFYKYCVALGVAETIGIVKNRMDLFDPFSPENTRKGWWQKGDTYIHRKIKIDSLFGNENVKEYANIIKLYLQDNLGVDNPTIKINPIVRSKFKQLQKTGLEAELFFLNNFQSLDLFKGGSIEDARLYGDGYDFQIDKDDGFFLIEVKGIRTDTGKFRLTNNEYEKAAEHKNNYILSAVINLDDIPQIRLIRNPLEQLDFKKVTPAQKPQIEYHLRTPINFKRQCL